MSAPVKVGEILAEKYVIERVLGAGGMGVVVAAKHLHLDERVAIKFLLPQALASGDVVARFKSEGRSAARIKSEHVAKVYDVGTLPDGAPYLVMEYLDGIDLGTHLRDQGPFVIAAAVDCVLQACEALADAHAAGIIHRDLKPGNLFLTKRNDGSPLVKLIDFGISKVTSGGLPGEGEMTQTAMMMGSPLYMAPEQMTSARGVDVRADIWSLGIILHTLLTGDPPFKASSVMEVYELIGKGAPPLRSARPGAPAGLEKIILRCLQKSRDERYSSVAELAAALAPFGPAGSTSSAERTARILKVKLRASSDSQPSLLELPGLAATQTAPSITGDPGGDSLPSVSRDRGLGEHTPSRRRLSVPLLLVALLTAVGAAAGVVVLLQGREAPPAPIPAVESSIVKSSPVVVAARPSGEPSVSVASAAPEPPPVLSAATLASGRAPAHKFPPLTGGKKPPADPFAGQQK